MSVAFALWLQEIGISNKEDIEPKTYKVLEAIWHKIEELEE